MVPAVKGPHYVALRCHETNKVTTCEKDLTVSYLGKVELNLNGLQSRLHCLNSSITQSISWDIHSRT